MPFHILAIITPKADRIARVEEIAKEVATEVEKNEPGTLKYQWFRTGTAEAPTIVVWEVYADEAAFETHKTSPALARLIEIEKQEGNLAAPLEVQPLEQFAGFASR
ncbi:uncharacterized protein B0T15DRAFT_524596 [Chaetomium strumarium]|uniref:ABM domain-containing protein n=1 Tax=Chaetomium strumarium TaxID=1170767 RepID=A0AAJ0GYI6_9PEZI|nr:hypothetical protein B0T15DRAFT_524596 [Chaetomium strumarium]